MARKFFSIINFGLYVFLTVLVLFYNKINLTTWLSMSGRLHPLLVHLPIGMFIFTSIIYFFRHKVEIKNIDTILRFGIDISLTTALLSSIVGVFLSVQHPNNTESFFNHKYSAYGLTTVLFLFSYIYNYNKWLDSLMFTLANILLIATGHFGGSITHGVDYLFPSKNKQIFIDSLNQNPMVFQAVIQPIFDQKCISCHKADKMKGGLLLTDTIGLKKGGDNGPIYIANNVSESRLAKYLRLPLDDEHHMPPDGKVQLTNAEINSIEYWIKTGAPLSKKLSDFLPNDSLALLCKSKLEKSKISEKVYTFEKASTDVINQLQSPFVSIKPISANSKALDVAFFVTSSYQSEKLKDILKLKEQIVKLSLINMPITSMDIDVITKFTNLEQLNLNGTPIQNQDFDKLSNLKNLSILSVTNTNLNGEIETSFPKFEKLKILYTFNTKTPFEKIELWKKKFSNITFHALKSNDEFPKLPMPLSMTDSTILKSGSKILLKTLIKGSIIKYTIDGSTPDSTNGITYNGPILIQNDLRIKAITLKDKWLRSDEAEFNFFSAGLKPSEVKIITKNNVKYPGTGANTLINLSKADVTDNADPNWIGFREESFIGIFTFNQIPNLRSIAICYSYNIPSYIFPPTDIKIFGSNNNSDYKLIKSQTLPRHQPAQLQTPFNAVEKLSFNPVNYKFYKLVINNLKKIPDWHPGKGEQGWLFLDEIFFYE